MRKPAEDLPAEHAEFIETLVWPLRELRASLGTGATHPSTAVLDALTGASGRVAGTEAISKRGLDTLEDSWRGAAAEAGLPVMRATRTEIAGSSERAQRYAAVLTAAQATSGRAAGYLDEIISDFGHNAKTMLRMARTSSDINPILQSWGNAMRDGTRIVNETRGEMDNHRRALREIDPPREHPPNATTKKGKDPQPEDPNLPKPSEPVLPKDPVAAAHLQLQLKLIDAGVDLGTSAINGGVELGAKLIDRLVDLGITTVETVGDNADTAIQATLNPQSTAPADADAPKDGPIPPKTFDFGGPKTDSPDSTPGLLMPKPPSTQKPPKTNTPDASTPDAKHPEPSQHQPHTPLVAPHPGGAKPEDKEHKPRQNGVITPASTSEDTTAPAVIESR